MIRRLAFALALLAPVTARADLPRRSPREPLAEVARSAVGADLLFERDGLAGRGAALCLVDTGVDPTLETLRDADDVSRVRWVWDAFAAPRGEHASVEAQVGGAVWGPGEIDEGPGDEHGHGTAMAALALGDGAPAGVREPGETAGVAVAARLIVARAYDAERRGFPDEAVVRGVRLCRLAATLDSELDPARLVILLSLGSHDGSHDGQGAFERAIVREAGSTPVVVAAGNDGGRAVHASGRALGDEPAVVDLGVPRPVEDAPSLTVTVRHERRGADAVFFVTHPSGARSPALTAQSLGEIVLAGTRVDVSPQEGEADTLRLRLSGTLEAGVYGISFEGDAAFDVWLAETRLGDTFLRPDLGGPFAREDETIRVPATSPDVIAVGASVARATVSTGGGVRTQDVDEAGAASFSSVGPTPAGVPKPDLVAPGGWVLVPLSADVREGDTGNLVGGQVRDFTGEDGRVAIRGSSVSAAVVAGALLLATERDPSRLARARALLVASADGEGWQPSVGWGQLDAPSLLERWGGAPGVAREASATRAYVPSDGRLWITARAPGSTLTIDLGRERWTAPLLAGATQLPLELGPRTVGEPLVFELAVDGEPLEPVTVAVELERGGAPRLGRGGCAVAPAATPPWALLLPAILLLTRRRGPGSCGRSAPGRRGGSRRRAARPCS